MDEETKPSSSSRRMISGTRTNQKGSMGRNAKGASHVTGKETWHKEIPTIRRRRTSMAGRNKPENTIPISKARTEMIRTLQSDETLLKHGIQIGNTAAMEDTQRVSCEPSYTIEGNGTTWAKLWPTTT
jgi:hypothetical protein